LIMMPVFAASPETSTSHVKTVVRADAKSGKLVRTFWVDLPVATYFMSSPGPGNCAEFGRTAPFDWGRLETLYGNYKTWSNKVSQSVDRTVKERWFTDYDGKKIKAELKVKAEPISVVAPNRPANGR